MFTKENLVKQLTKAIKRQEEKKAKMAEQLLQAQNWEKTQQEAQLLSSYFFKLKKGQEAVSLPYWENSGSLKTIALDAKLSPEENIQKYFSLAKKLRKAIPYTEKLLLKYSKNIEILQQLLSRLEKDLEISEKEYTPFLPQNVKKVAAKAPEKKSSFRLFKDEAGNQIWVGKSAESNDELTFKKAKSLDLWLHVANYSGSHVIIKNQGKPIDEKTLYSAMQLAMHFSKARELGRADIIIAEKKDVSQAGKKNKANCAGKVVVRKYKTVTIDYDRQLLQKILSAL